MIINIHKSGRILDRSSKNVSSEIVTIQRPHISDEHFKFNYQKLTMSERRNYDDIEKALSMGISSVILRNTVCDQNGYNKIFSAILDDNPALYYVSKRFMIKSSGKEVRLDFKFNGLFGKRKEYDSILKDKLFSVYNMVSSSSNTIVDAEIAIHDYLLDTVTYDGHEEELAHSLIGPLCYGRGVCEGISAAFSFLANGVGIKASTITGVTTDGSPHRWNIVEINGIRYHMDVTSDLDGKKHNYVNITDEMIRRTHRFDIATGCNDDSLFYYKYKDMYYDNYEEVRKVLKKKLFCSNGSFEFYLKENTDPNVILKEAVKFVRKATIYYSGNYYKIQF